MLLTLLVYALRADACACSVLLEPIADRLCERLPSRSDAGAGLSSRLTAAPDEQPVVIRPAYAASAAAQTVCARCYLRLSRSAVLLRLLRRDSSGRVEMYSEAIRSASRGLLLSAGGDSRLRLTGGRSQHSRLGSGNYVIRPDQMHFRIDPDSLAALRNILDEGDPAVRLDRLLLYVSSGHGRRWWARGSVVCCLLGGAVLGYSLYRRAKRPPVEEQLPQSGSAAPHTGGYAACYKIQPDALATAT